MTPQGSDPWMPNGFPPPSFVVETERTRTFVGPRGRWLAAAAILGAVLLIAGIVLIANQGDDSKTALNTGSSTTAVGDTSPTFTSTTPLDPTATLPNATVPPGDPGVTAPGATATTSGPVTTAAPGPTVAPGILTPSTGSLAIPKVDSSVGGQSAKLTLRNTGGSNLDYGTRSNFPGLTVDKPSGGLAAGASTELTITLNGSGAKEGPFTGVLSFDAAGSSKTVSVTSTVGRPPSFTDNAGMNCPTETPTCVKQVKPNSNAAGATPCNGPWRYRVTVGDESSLKAVRADLTNDVELRINNAPNGPSGIWESADQAALQPGTSITFTLEAVDQFDFSRRSTPRTITCPAA